MSKIYDVHIFAIVRVKVSGVAAESQKEAISKASQQEWPKLYERFETDESDFAEEISHYLVDEVGDEDYDNSKFYVDSHHLQLQKDFILAGEWDFTEEHNA